MRRSLVLAVIVWGCSSGNTGGPPADARTSVSDSPQTSVPLDLTLDKLTTEQADQLCQDILSWARQVTEAEGGAAQNDAGFCGDDAHTWAYLAGGDAFDAKACNDRLSSCMGAARDGDLEVFGSCRWVAARSSCSKLPTVEALLRCEGDYKHALVARFASFAGLSCDELAPKPLGAVTNPDSCKAIDALCGTLL
jgi:hypothetical protein